MNARIATLAALLAIVPALLGNTSGDNTSGDPVPADACAETAGRDALTADGYAFTFDAPPPVGDAYGLGGYGAANSGVAPFHFYIDVAPHPQADVKFTLAWDEPSDVDLFVYDQAGELVGESTAFNPLDGNGETVEATLDDCAAVQVEVVSYAATISPLTLEVSLTPAGDATEGIAPRPADDRKSLWLGGDRPGQLTTVQNTAGTDLHPRLEEERPTNADPNQITRPVVGFANYRNPLVPWWHADAYTNDALPVLSGTPSAIVWVSSPTEQADPGEVLVQLYVNGGLHDEVAIPGSEVPPTPTPFVIEFVPVDEQAFSVTLQVTPVPTVSSSDPEPNNVGDATHTVWYDSVQYPARLLLPVVRQD